MANRVSTKSLSVIIHKNIPVITTELLAELYGTEPAKIRKNHNRNADRFVDGKHFYKGVISKSGVWRSGYVPL